MAKMKKLREAAEHFRKSYPSLYARYALALHGKAFKLLGLSSPDENNRKTKENHDKANKRRKTRKA